MDFIDENIIVLDRELNDLDKFVLEFINTLDEINYVLISGYVALLLKIIWV